MVILEIINEIDRRIFFSNGPTSAGSVQNIRDEMAKNYQYYAKTKKWDAVDRQRDKIHKVILDLIVKSEVIICRDLPGDTAKYNMTKQVAKNVHKLSHKGVSPADVFHYHFMNRYGLKIAVSQDKHFQYLPGITVHTFKSDFLPLPAKATTTK